MSTKSATRPTATPAPTPTPTASRPRFPAAKHANDLTRFELSLRSRLARTMRDENRTGVIVLATDYRTAKDGMDELWFVHWECGRAAYIRDQTSSIFTAITNTALEDYGGQPDRVRIYSVSDYNQFPDKTSYIDVAWAKRALDGPMEIDEYEMKYLRTIRTASSDESEIAYEMTVEDSGNETATIAFDQHRDIPSNMSDRDCPWGVEGVNNDEGTG